MTAVEEGGKRRGGGARPETLTPGGAPDKAGGREGAPPTRGLLPRLHVPPSRFNRRTSGRPDDKASRPRLSGGTSLRPCPSDTAPLRRTPPAGVALTRFAGLPRSLSGERRPTNGSATARADGAGRSSCTLGEAGGGASGAPPVGARGRPGSREVRDGHGGAGAAVGAGLPRGRAACRRAPAGPRPHGCLRAGRRLRLPGAGQHQGAGRRLRAPRDARLPQQGAARPGAGQLPVQHGHLQHGRAQAAAARRPQVQRDDATPQTDLRGRHPHAALPALPDRHLRADLAGGRRELLRLGERGHPRGDRRRDPPARLRVRQLRGLRGGHPPGRPELHRGGGRRPPAGPGPAAQGGPDRPAGDERAAARGPPGAHRGGRPQGLQGRPRRAGPGGARAPAGGGRPPGELSGEVAPRQWRWAEGPGPFSSYCVAPRRCSVRVPEARRSINVRSS